MTNEACPSPGTGGFHSDGYSDGAPCRWCGAVYRPFAEHARKQHVSVDVNYGVLEMRIAAQTEEQTRKPYKTPTLTGPLPMRVTTCGFLSSKWDLNVDVHALRRLRKFQHPTPCPECNGAGFIYVVPCTRCKSTGRVL